MQKKRRVRQRTFAFCSPEELEEAIQSRAQAERVPPSEVAERILPQARAMG